MTEETPDLSKWLEIHDNEWVQLRTGEYINIFTGETGREQNYRALYGKSVNQAHQDRKKEKRKRDRRDLEQRIAELTIRLSKISKL